MDKETRARLLRERLRAVRGYDLPYRPKSTKPAEGINPRPFRNFIHLCVGQHAKEMPKLWICEADEIEPDLTPQTRRVAHKSALTRIAERWGELKLAAVPLGR